MNRRKFFRDTMGLGFTPVFLNSMALKAYSNINQLNDFTCAQIQNRTLVMIDLFGGNDGLNTVIGVDKYSVYKGLRPTIAIPDTGTGAYINLDTTLPIQQQVGLHPSLTGFKALYDQGKLNIINGTGYANNNRSHFKANDQWLSAGDSTPALRDLESGWAGRYLQVVYPNNIDGPTASLPDPLGLELGASSASFLYKTEQGKFANLLLGLDASSYYTFVAGLGIPAPTTYPASQMVDEINYINSVEQATNAYSQRISATFNAGSNSVTYPNNGMANQLKTVARLLKGGSKTKVFLVHMTGFDTHANQVVAGSPHTGAHATLLKTLGDAVKAFMDDLQAMGLDDNVVACTYSEFGRTVDENAGKGTDHGGVNPMFVFGKPVKGGVSGTPVDLTKVSQRGCIDLQYDYRRIFAALMQDYIAVDDTVLTAARLDAFKAQKAPVLKPEYIAPVSCYSGAALPVTIVDFDAQAVNESLVKIYWTTVSESNSLKYDVERSTDGIKYEYIGTVKAAGNSAIERKYEMFDKNPAEGTNYYRLKQIDKDQRYEIYGPVTVRIRNKKQVVTASAFPNPAAGEFNVTIVSPKDQSCTLQLFDIEGHLLKQQQANIKIGKTIIPYNTASLKNGQYIIRLHTNDGTVIALKQVIMK
jgi:uncharacterized protein (DUF1501 family)